MELQSAQNSWTMIVFQSEIVASLNQSFDLFLLLLTPKFDMEFGYNVKKSKFAVRSIEIYIKLVSVQKHFVQQAPETSLCSLMDHCQSFLLVSVWFDHWDSLLQPLIWKVSLEHLKYDHSLIIQLFTQLLMAFWNIFGLYHIIAYLPGDGSLSNSIHNQTYDIFQLLDKLLIFKHGLKCQEKVPKLPKLKQVHW